jgi:hypothetical protein
MTNTQYIGMDVHKESISIAVRNGAGKIVMECVIETKANIILVTTCRRGFCHCGYGKSLALMLVPFWRTIEKGFRN